jgi:hypothetical protein
MPGLPFDNAIDKSHLSLRDKVALFGPDAIPLIIPYGSKGQPVAGSPWNRYMKGWEKRTLADTRAEAYQADLYSDIPKNIAIRQGGGLTSLCAFDFDTNDPAVAEEFCRANPFCRTGIFTVGNRGFTVWVRMKGPYPSRKQIVWARGKPGETGYEAVEWRGHGYSIVAGRHPAGPDYRIFDGGQEGEL